MRRGGGGGRGIGGCGGAYADVKWILSDLRFKLEGLTVCKYGGTRYSRTRSKLYVLVGEVP